MKLHEAIEKERERQGISRYKLAKAIDTNPTNYGKIADGLHSPSLDMMFRICKELNICITLCKENKVTITNN